VYVLWETRTAYPPLAHAFTSMFFCGPCCSSFPFSVLCILFCLILFSLSCVQGCLFFWIIHSWLPLRVARCLWTVHSWLPLQFSLTFMYIHFSIIQLFCSREYGSYTFVYDVQILIISSCILFAYKFWQCNILVAGI
jgi:hypothetical protein